MIADAATRRNSSGLVRSRCLLWLAWLLAGWSLAALPLRGRELDLPLAGVPLFVDPAAAKGHCTAGDLLNDTGSLGPIRSRPTAPGLYLLHARLKMLPIASVHTVRFTFAMTVSDPTGALGSSAWTPLEFEQPGVWQDFTVPVRVQLPESVLTLTIAWNWMGTEMEKRPPPKIKPPPPGTGATLAGEEGTEEDLKLEFKLAELEYYLALERAWLEPLENLAIRDLTVNKIRYQPGERAWATGAVLNCGAQARTVQLRTILTREVAEEQVLEDRPLTVEAGATLPFRIEFTLPQTNWGYELRCVLRDGERELTRAAEYFTVHPNPWAVVIAAPTFQGTVYRAGAKGEKAPSAAAGRKALYGNEVEFVFWGPDDFGNFNPRGPFGSGQMHYDSSEASTRQLIAACHEVGIACAFYAKFCTAGGKSGYDLLRRHPDWLVPDFYDVAQLARWDRSQDMVSWPQLGVRRDQDEAYRHHAREIVRSVKDFGWDMIRYDSDDTAPDVPHLLGIIQGIVRPACPQFQWGYNSGIHRTDKPAPGAWEILCRDGSLIMDEYTVHAVKDGWTFEYYTERQIGTRAKVHTHGGHVFFIAPDAYANESLYQLIFPYVTRIHTGAPKSGGSSVNISRLATRFAGTLWDNTAVPLPDAERRLDWGAAKPFLFRPTSYAYIRPRGEGRADVILHLVNAPAYPKFGATDDGRLPPPRLDLAGAIELPAGLQAQTAWWAAPGPEVAPAKLPFTVADGRVRFTVPKLRLWSMVVLECTGRWAP